jgi:hypothetical protein
MDVISERSGNVGFNKGLDEIVEVCGGVAVGSGREVVGIVLWLGNSSHFEPLLSVFETIFQRRRI